jgi:putative transposase
MKYLDGNYYHVFNRGSRKGNIFFSEENYSYLLRLIKANAKKYSTSIVAYCLMPNHYHLLLFQQEGGSISKTLQTTINSYVQAVNKKYDFSGSLFEDRAKSILVETDRYVVHLARYIHLNPVRAKLVVKPDEWMYSDYSRWVGTNNLSNGF